MPHWSINKKQFESWVGHGKQKVQCSNGEAKSKTLLIPNIFLVYDKNKNKKVKQQEKEKTKLSSFREKKDLCSQT